MSNSKHIFPIDPNSWDVGRVPIDTRSIDTIRNSIRAYASKHELKVQTWIAGDFIRYLLIPKRYKNIYVRRHEK